MDPKYCSLSLVWVICWVAVREGEWLGECLIVPWPCNFESVLVIAGSYSCSVLTESIQDEHSSTQRNNKSGWCYPCCCFCGQNCESVVESSLWEIQENSQVEMSCEDAGRDCETSLSLTSSQALSPFRCLGFLCPCEIQPFTQDQGFLTVQQYPRQVSFLYLRHDLSLIKQRRKYKAADIVEEINDIEWSQVYHRAFHDWPQPC